MIGFLISVVTEGNNIHGAALGTSWLSLQKRKREFPDLGIRRDFGVSPSPSDLWNHEVRGEIEK
jgi:hypothetical protein